ncbi:kinase domain protein (macronuclear) [Tetrahymena thermophila SB210]|uniref:Kinase domain protein n=1 Tax=Tetrahymena thermophila (strain SB210) TaxID=312017 RepID=Q23C17_TETTS|nr:kinase domain protein [Tetrahymena thermophila SB210]EAR93951.2 kinase domain protein [Tetrahymena thermophila SB210]|eukprot:XP_001014196.2 kinase domain protein [Tetrahymena thermophila SB210]
MNFQFTEDYDDYQFETHRFLNQIYDNQYYSHSSENSKESSSENSNQSFIFEIYQENSPKISGKPYFQRDENPEINLNKLKCQQQLFQASLPKNSIIMKFEKFTQKVFIRKVLNHKEINMSQFNNFLDNLAQQKQSFTPEIIKLDKKEMANKNTCSFMQQAGIADFFQIKSYMKAFRNQYENANEQIWEFLQYSFCQLNEKLNQMHQLKIVHGDIKPQNIILSKEGSCYFIDFDASIQINDNDIQPSFISDHLKHKTSFYNNQQLINLIQNSKNYNFFTNIYVLYLIDRMQLHLTFIYLICQSELFLELFEKKEIKQILQNLQKYYYSTQKNKEQDDQQQLIEIDQNQSVEINGYQDFKQPKQNIQCSSIASQNSKSTSYLKQQFILVDEQMPLYQSYEEFVSYLFNQYLIIEETLLAEFDQYKSNSQRIKELFNQNQKLKYASNYNQENLFRQFVTGYQINLIQKDEIEVISLNRIFSFWLNYTEQIFNFNENLVINELINLGVLDRLKLKLKEFCFEKFEKAEENRLNSALFYLYRQQFQENNTHQYDLNNNLELNNFIQALYLNPQMAKMSINVSKQHQMDTSLIKKLLQTLQFLPNLKTLKLSLINQNVDNLFNYIDKLFQKLEQFKIEVSTISEINHLNLYGFPIYSLKYLNISFLSSNITDNQLINITNILQYCQLETIKLNLSNCQSITDNCISEIFSSFSLIQTLKSLNLVLRLCCQLTQQSINSLIDHLKQNRSVDIEIDFSDCSKILPNNFDDLLNYINTRSKISYNLCIKYNFLVGNKEFKQRTQKISQIFEKIKFKQTRTH